jgi:formate--tetrahydrofolate ligase
VQATESPLKKLLPIQEIARKLNLPEEYLEPRSPYTAKISLGLLKDERFPIRGKFILITATTPTKAGEGKTVTSIGLAQGLEKIGKRSIVTSREPSLGPVFGIKGGAAGGGASQVEPSEKINLHFHGDFHAITSAHNLLAAMIDAHLFHGNELDLDPERITWPRTMDMNDRALRHITVAQGAKSNGIPRQTGFVITAASEVMAIMGMASSLADLRKRIGSIVVGFNRAGKPVRAEDLHATGSMMALLSEAILPNLVQTTEGTPATVHTGPFGNIAHGTSSIISQTMGMKLAEYVVNECGFAADLGAEKYIDLVMRSSGFAPAAAVLVTSVRSMREQGAGSLSAGLPNLGQHIRILQGFGVPVVVALNKFPTDGEDELAEVERYCSEQRVPSARSEAYAKGGDGAVDLARKVVETISANPTEAKSLYPLEMSLENKVQTVATRVYGAADVEFSEKAQEKLRHFTELGFGNLPVCIAKTQHSITDDATKLGAPTGWTLRVRDVNLSAGAGWVVVVCGSIMLMPGLPKVSRTFGIDVDDEGNVTGIT